MTVMLLVLILALVLFGPQKTYALALEAGRYAGMIKRAARDLQREVELSNRADHVDTAATTTNDKQIYLSPSNVTVPGRKVEDISDPQAPEEPPASEPEDKPEISQEDRPREN